MFKLNIMSIEEILRELISFETINNPTENKFPKPDILHYIAQNILSPAGYVVSLLNKNNYCSLIGYIKKSSPTVLLLGHCDVVPPGPHWDYDPFEYTVVGDKAYGRGTADMKGSVATMLSLAKEFSDNSTATIVYAITLDEESGGVFGARELIPFLKKRGLLPNYVINGDANGLQIINRRRNPYLINVKIPKDIQKTKGTIKTRAFTTEVAGNRTMHAAYFNRSIDRHCAEIASEFLIENNLVVKSIYGDFVKNNVLPSKIEVQYIEENDAGEEQTYDKNLTSFLYSLKDFRCVDLPSEHSDYGINLTFNYYRSEGSYHLCQLDLRVMSNDNQHIKNYFEKFFKDHNVKNCLLSLEGGSGKVNTPINSPLIKASIEIAKKLDLSPVPIEMGGATDSRWFGALDIPTVEFGPLGGNVHGANEHIIRDTLPIVQEFYKLLISRLSKIY